METVIAYLVAHWDDLLLIATSTITVASLIAKLTPNKSDDAVVDKILGVINFLALNKRK